MTGDGSDTPSPGGQSGTTAPSTQDIIVDSAKQSVSQLLTAVFSGLTADVEALLKKNGANTPAGQPVGSFTTDLIKLLQQQVTDALTKSGSK